MNNKKPKGELITRNLCMPNSGNPVGKVFGGWMLYELDKAGSIFAERTSLSQIATVSITDIVFFKPFNIGDTFEIYAELIKVGNSSMKFKLEGWVDCPSYGEELREKGSHFKAIEAIFICVAVDSKGNPKKINKI